MAALLALGLLGCKQGIGDRCQVDTDCAENLCCAYIGTPVPSTGGACQPCQADATVPLPDALISDASDAATDATDAADDAVDAADDAVDAMTD